MSDAGKAFAFRDQFLEQRIFKPLTAQEADKLRDQLKLYRESLLNPPLLIVCDFDRYLIRTNFNGTVKETHELTNDQIDRPENLRTLRALFENPDFLKPQRTTAQVTENLAETIAEVAKSEITAKQYAWSRHIPFHYITNKLKLSSYRGVCRGVKL